MKNLSPLDIYNKEFGKATLGGYKTTAVDDFLDEVGMAYEKLLKEINSLKSEKEKLEEKLNNYESIEDKLRETLTSVQETAREQTRQAKREADMIIQKANMDAEKIINETKRKLKEEYRTMEQLREAKQLFKIRYRNLLESHLQLLKEDEDEIEGIDLDEVNLEKARLDE